ncbi:OmpA/MotB family outer membrane protein [Caballeronia sordidicola]|uniref:OmpA/MotB family outer membrane protein n=1 Tax=Caballeronia sordidicola TaxID=196367 RepID=A0A158IB81_CABSO|nr:type VI secretion system protein TssL, long form [Caballeronia sordidicola]SAL53280.1 OmpA/MotB family outer membrane protein [Caballeronia sordidicola]
MTNDTDPTLDDSGFLDAARTIMLPTPGLKRERAAAARTTAKAPALAPLDATLAGRNPLLRAANPLLELALPLRRLTSHPDLEALRTQLIQMVRTFEANGRAFGVPDAQLGPARYCLCTFIDESIAATPWGAGVWGRRSLLVTFHNEASGGERLFVILQRLAQTPAIDVDLLELIYVMLALGFDGRYRLMEGGKTQLDVIRERLEQMIRAQRAPIERALSPHWQPAPRERKRLLQFMPLWVALALAAFVLVTASLVLSFRINDFSDPVFASMRSIRVAPAPVLASKVDAAPKLSAALAGFLAPEIAQGLVSVGDSADRTTVTINNTATGTQLFASGSADLDPHFSPLMQRIGDALQDKPGNVIVIGHTDNQRIISARFPSNVALSQARADTVRAILAARINSPARLSAEGRGDTDPVASNDTPAGRAKNRRVAIVILSPGAAS